MSFARVQSQNIAHLLLSTFGCSLSFVVTCIGHGGCSGDYGLGAHGGRRVAMSNALFRRGASSQPTLPFAGNLAVSEFVHPVVFVREDITDNRQQSP